MKLSQTNIDRLIAEVAADETKRQAAIQDPRAFVVQHFELTDAQRHLFETSMNLIGDRSQTSLAR